MSQSIKPNTNAETDDRFPSGPWKGFFLQPRFSANRKTMSLHLSFSAGKISGEGNDLIGDFIITGRYDLKSGKVWLHKRYVRRYEVFYRGYGEQDRGIGGVWEIRDLDRAGFHIWPKGMPDPTKLTLKGQAGLPVQRATAVMLVEAAP